MKSIDKVIEKFPEDLRLPMYEALTIAIEESRNILIRDEITKVWEAIGELAEAQKRTEERLTRLEKVVEELAETQKRTEERLTRLEKVVEELAEAQKRTEQRVNELAEAQKRTEQRVNELAEAQKRTEESLRNLITEFGEMKKQIGGITDTIGYTLENEAFKHLPQLLLKDLGIKIEEKIKRTYLKNIEGEEKEVNIYGIGKRNGEEVTIIGEAKSQLSKNEIDRFLKRIEKFKGLYKNIVPIMVTHMISEPDAEDYAKAKGIKIYYSYDF